MASPLGPVFVEKVNGFLSLWGRALGRASLPAWTLFGGKKGPLTLDCVGPGPPTAFLGLRCGEWVLLDWGCCLLPLSWVAGSLRSLTAALVQR